MYENYEECKIIIKLLSSDFSEIVRSDIRNSMSFAESYRDDSSRIYRLTDDFKQHLWEVPEAVEQGFASYLKQESLKAKELLHYHERHCPNEGCVVCLKLNKFKMRNFNERAEPEICPK